MDYPRPCGCKGCRTCLLCEKEYGITKKTFTEKYKDLPSYVYCLECNKIYPGWDVNIVLENHANHVSLNGENYPGVFIQNDFLTNTEEEQLMNGIDSMPWDISQSGRRKQNYGPKTNFKKMKLQLGEFKGFPKFSKFIQDRFQLVPLLKNFQTIEQCSLEYDPKRGASIDPHIDDCWVWGERVVTVNCLTDSVLTMARYKGGQNRYNLPLVESYKNLLIGKLRENNDEELPDILVRIPMPRKSLIVLYGPARYEWEHCVLREDITERRVCVAYREFTPFYLEAGKDFNLGQPVLKQAKNFWEKKTENVT